MTDTRTVGHEIQGQILDTVRKSQDAVVDALKTWTETVQSITPSIPTPSLPLADKLPKPEELVASAYDFAEQLLASQRKFAESVLEVTGPVTAKKNGTAASARKADSPAK
ncbi:MAG: hypothetical protein QOJ73_3296 [Streptosporangiaceae bacterium]|nr:hypothetical protein [Streptosporangiaceae bacterium]